MDTNATSGADPLAALYRLHTQLRLLVSAFTVAPDTPEVAIMLAGLADTTDEAASLLTAAEPTVLSVLRRAFQHAEARRHNETTSELLTAHRRLSILLRRDRPRRTEAAHEPTLRWYPPTTLP